MVLIVFFWRSWQFSVEAQCLRLKTTIINVCKDKAKNIVVNNGPNAGGTTSSTEDHADEDEILAIKFEEKTGEAMVSKKLYEDISKIILPLDYLLFRFFRRVVFVSLYAVIMFMVLSLSRKTGLSAGAQALSAIVGILIPFIFDTIYADNHKAQRNSINIATKAQVGHLLKVHKRENNIIRVELVNNLTS
ncbi:uncharacterized protein LOC114524071 [Dendronephthya gigantea]|uniref:uncharacterized protein LOC114524071 n=1 Tax=Dendronephthya gigantea TaxID=151771 RepID=UPI0010690C0D|nr:uncharacterized protein LOC114524071 [Dendronephthya gigantea]